MTTGDWRPMIRALLYVVQFDEDPALSVDHALKGVVHKGALAKQPSDYAWAIDEALRSSEQLSKLMPQPHTEETVRRFLGELRSKL